jgi:hypothetical protein
MASVSVMPRNADGDHVTSWRGGVLVLAVLTSACRHDAAPPRALSSPPAVVTASPSSPSVSPQPVLVRYRIERHVRDAADFASVVQRTLTDPRGWQRGGFRLLLHPRARFRVVLAEPAEAERLCRPYDVFSKYSCQNGPVVVVNAARWRHATPEWTGSLSAYRQMLVNHEFGHLLGMHHPAVQCPRRGALEAVMAQQSTELNGCLPNPWPLPTEIRRAARHDLPLAPPATP